MSTRVKMILMYTLVLITLLSPRSRKKFWNVMIYSYLHKSLHAQSTEHGHNTDSVPVAGFSSAPQSLDPYQRHPGSRGRGDVSEELECIHVRTWKRDRPWESETNSFPAPWCIILTSWRHRLARFAITSLLMIQTWSCGERTVMKVAGLPA